MKERVLSLAELDPFAWGKARHCYVHPDDPNLCIKVPASDDKRCHAQQRMDIEDYAWMKKHGSAHLFDRIPEIKAVIETDRGLGIVTRLYRDVEGSISRPLSGLIAERGLSSFVSAIDEWKRWVRQHRLLTQDTGPHNLVAVHLGRDEWKLVIVEGWRNPKHHWLAELHPFFLDWMIDRQLRKFDRRTPGS